jgi:hypothetical protein
MKELVEYLAKNNLVFKSLKVILPFEIGSRKKIDIYLGVDLKKNYCCLFQIHKKSRFITKDASEIIDLEKRLETFNKSKINFRYIVMNVPLCSKAKRLLEENGFMVMENKHYLFIIIL